MGQNMWIYDYQIIWEMKHHKWFPNLLLTYQYISITYIYICIYMYIIKNILYIKIYQHKYIHLSIYIYIWIVFSFLSGFLVVLFGLPCFFSQTFPRPSAGKPSSSSPFVGLELDCGSVPLLYMMSENPGFLCVPVENVGMENQQATRLTILHSGKTLHWFFFSRSVLHRIFFWTK